MKKRISKARSFGDYCYREPLLRKSGKQIREELEAWARADVDRCISKFGKTSPA